MEEQVRLLVSRHNLFKLGTNAPATTEMETRSQELKLEIAEVAFQEKLWVQAKTTERLGTGSRGGYPREMIYNLTLQFDSEDIAAIAQFAIEKGFVRVSISPPDKAA